MKISVLFVFVVLLLTCCESKSNDDIDLIRQRVLEISIWPIPSNIPSTVESALMFSENLNRSCYWPDVDYFDQSINVWATATHMYRITTMLQALTVNGSKIQNNSTIMSKVHCSLKVWFDNDWQNPNWWFNQIDIPLQATSQLLMLNQNATDAEIDKIKQISYRAAWWLHRPQDIGTNLVWMIQSQIYRSLATRNLTGLEQGFSQMWQDVRISPLLTEGVQSDYAYHFHGSQIYSGGYGFVWADNLFLFLRCSFQTKYEPSQEQLTVFGDFLTKGDAWMIVNNQFDFNVVGRSVSRPFELRINFVPQWIRDLAQQIENNQTKFDLFDFADRIENRPNAKLLLGNKHFYTSDYQAHRRVNWTATIKMQSIRTLGSECTNGENRKDEHGGQGILNLYSPQGLDYHFIFPLFDWQAINGITVEHDIPIEPCTQGLFPVLTQPFVGGVSDGFYGLAVMDTISHNLTAQRSWHFYDDAIFALATNLTLTTSNVAWTTLASRLLNQGQITVGFLNSTVITLNDGNYSFPYDSNVQWIHVGQSDIAYLFQTQQQYESIGIRLGVESGNYDSIDVYNYSVTARTLTIWIDHGLGPLNLEYQYIILPNISLESLPNTIQQYEEEQIFKCISTNKLFHGMVWPSLKRASFVLWQNMTTTFSCQSPSFNLNIQLSDAGIYLFSETDFDFTLTASQPIRINGVMNITIDRIGYGAGCTTLNNLTNVTLTLPSSLQFLGSSVDMTCKKTKFEKLEKNKSFI